jgi:hypothetical protein
MVNPPRMHFGGVRVGVGLGVGSLILTPNAFLLMTFSIFFGGDGVAAALHLLARVREDPALGPFDESPVDSGLRV